MSAPVWSGYSPIGFVRCGRSSCRATAFVFKVGKETGGKKMESPHSLKSNEMAQVTFQPMQPLVVDSFKNCEGLSRIAFLDGNTAVMLGKVVSVIKKSDMPPEEKAKKAMVDAARLADELRAEQDHTNTQSKSKRALETQLSELEQKFADANENAIRGGRAAMAKLETRIRELEVELGNVQAHTGENSKGYQKSERRSKELAFQIEEVMMSGK